MVKIVLDLISVLSLTLELAECFHSEPAGEMTRNRINIVSATGLSLELCILGSACTFLAVVFSAHECSIA